MSYATNLNTYLNPTPETILRRGSYGTKNYEEYQCGATSAPYPGMLVQINANGRVTVQTSVGGDVPVIVAVEDALQGYTINDQYVANNIVRCLIAEPGHVIQGPIPIGVQTSVGTPVVSAGDGSWTPSTGLAYTNLYVTTANSNSVTNTTAATSFGQTYSIPAASLAVGDVLHIVAQGSIPNTATNSTLNTALKLGSTVIGSTGAVDPADADVWQITADIVVRAVGASGSIIASGWSTLGTGGTATEKVFTLAPTNTNTNAAILVDVLATWNAASTSDITHMDMLAVERIRATKDKPLGLALTAVNNVGGSGYQFVDILVF